MISGNCDDEGTLFSISTMNISTTADLKDYLKLYIMPKATDSQVDLFLEYYPDDQRAGSPFDTGIKNALSAVQAYGRYSGRFRLPRPASVLLEKQGRQAEVVGIHF